MLPSARHLQQQAAHQAAIAAAAQQRQAAAAQKAAAAQARAQAQENARQARLSAKQREVDARQQRRQAQWAAHHPAAAAYLAGSTSGDPSTAPLAPITTPAAAAGSGAGAGAAADPYSAMGATGTATTAGDQAAGKPAGKSWWGSLSTFEKVGVVAGGAVAVGGLYVYSKYRKVTAPLRHFQRVAKAVQG